MNVIEAINTRKSIRKYKPEPIPDSDLKKILKAAQLAPSAGNKQPWKFIIIKDSETKKELAKKARNQLWIADAGVVVAALAMDKKPVQGLGKGAIGDGQVQHDLHFGVVS